MKTGLEPEKIYCMVYDYSGNTNNVYGKVLKINEVDENIYVKIEKPITKSRFSVYQHKDLCGTRFDANENCFNGNKEYKMTILEKYENWGFLDNVQENKKEELSELFENFTKYLLNIVGEENLQWGKCDFSIIFIPLIRKLFTEYGEKDYVKVYNDFKNWYEIDGVEWETSKNNIELFDFVGLYLQHYKSKQ